jgi:hypothetical protein
MPCSYLFNLEKFINNLESIKENLGLAVHD